MLQAWRIKQGIVELEQSRANIALRSKRDVVIKVKAIGLNRADLLQIQGLYPAPDGSNIPGLEISGIIEDTGEAVCALLPSGGFATHVVVDKRLLIPKPKGFSFEEAAALPEALITTYLNLFKLAKLKNNQSILIHGANSGIGSFAIKCAESIGAKVYATTGRDGPNLINYNTAEWGVKVDVVLDILGGKFVSQNINALNSNGTYISIAVMQGSKAEINMAAVLMKNIKIIGSTLRSKPLPFKARLIKKAQKFISEHPIRPIIDSVYDFNNLPQALKRLEDRLHIGKVVVRVDY